MGVLAGYDVNSEAISRDGRRVAVGGYVDSNGPLGGVRVFTQGKRESYVLPFAPPVSGNGLAFSPAGHRLAAITPNHTLRISDLGDPARTWELSVGDKGSWAVRAHDGRGEGAGKHGRSGVVTAGVLVEALR